MVVAVDRLLLAGGGREVVAAGAEVDRGGQGGVVDVLGVALGVAVGVHADDRPGRGDELHGADRAVPAGVVVELAAVGVGDRGGALGAVERQAEDAGGGDALVVEYRAAEAAVVGLHTADRGDQLPGKVAGLVGGVDDGLGALVGGERGGGDAGGRGGGDDLGGVLVADAGGQGAGGDRGGGLDGLRGHRGAVGQRSGRDLVGAGRDRAHGGCRDQARGPCRRHEREGHQGRAPLPASGSVSCHRVSPSVFVRVVALPQARDRPNEWCHGWVTRVLDVCYPDDEPPPGV